MKNYQPKQHLVIGDHRFCVPGMLESVPLIDHKAAKRHQKKQNKFSYRRRLYENGGRVCVYGLPESVPGYRGRKG